MTKFLTIGTATADIFIKSDFFKEVSAKNYFDKSKFKSGVAQCMPSGSKIEIKEPIISSGGGAYNSAVTFSRAEFKTYSIFEIGNDFFGKKIFENAKSEKIIPLEIINKKGNTGISFIFIDKKGERTVLVSRGVSSDLYDDNIVSMIPEKVDWAYVAPGNMPINFLEKLFSFMNRERIKIALSPSKGLIGLGVSRIKNLLNKSSIIALNREEASLLTKTPYSEKKKIFEVLDKYVAGIVVMTDGKNNTIISDGKTMFESGVFKEKRIVDKTGAGDAFGSGFVAGLVEFDGKDDEEKIKYAIRRASASATSVIEHIGANVGILSAKDFLRNNRWGNLKIVSRKIN